MGGQTGHLLVGPTGAKGRPLNVTRATNYYTIPVTQGATDLLRLHPPPRYSSTSTFACSFVIDPSNIGCPHILSSLLARIETWIRASPKFLDHLEIIWNYLHHLSGLSANIDRRIILFFKDSVRFEQKSETRSEASRGSDASFFPTNIRFRTSTNFAFVIKIHAR